jgi:transcription initiation factor TFIIIB Brf1 subunit/transcription initiation factor TFIIB
VAAVIFIASRLTDNPKHIKQILTLTEVTEKEMNSCYKRIKEIIPEAKVTVNAV